MVRRFANVRRRSTEPWRAARARKRRSLPLVAAILFGAEIALLLSSGAIETITERARTLVKGGSAGPDLLLPGLETITGRARIIDGDTIEIANRRIRLYGVDAPEAGQKCSGFAAGAYSTRALRDLIGGRQVTCRVRDIDRYGRAVSSCTVSGEDIEERLVREGAAFAYARYKKGLWPYGCTPPEAYRRSR
jgi:endonuclease YncB( thermonuclease family)